MLNIEQYEKVIEDIKVNGLKSKSKKELQEMSIKEDCLNRLVLIGVSSLRCAVTHYVEHYHSERNHQGLDSKVIHPEFNPLPTEGAIKRRKRLGGLLNYYYGEAA